MISSSSQVKILIVDDHPSVCAGLSALLSTQSDLVVCGEAATEIDGITLVEKLEPDLVIVDIGLEEGNGLNLIKRIKQRYPAVKMLVLSGFHESLYAERCIRAGALGYFNKQEPSDELLDALRRVLRGEHYLSETLQQRLDSQALTAHRETEAPINRLTDRELEVFRMIGEGLITGQIASRIEVSTRTVDNHRENLERKLGARNAAELTREAVRWVRENC